MDHKNILFISAGQESSLVYKALDKLKKEGYKIYLISDADFKPNTNIFEKQFLFDITKTLDTFNFIKDQKINFGAIITKSVDPVTPLIALLSKHYGCIGNDPKTAFYCKSKYHMRKKLAEAGIREPKFALCKNYEDVKNAVKRIGIPCVAKPIGWHSSFGTFMIRDKKDLEKLESNYKASIEFLLKEIKEICPYTKEELDLIGVDDEVNMVTDYLVEGYLDGSEISVDAITQDGVTAILGIAEQIRMAPPYFVEVAEKIPYICDQKTLKKIKRLTEQTISAMGIKNSPTHTEIIFTKNGPKIVEIACRSGADNIHDAIYHITGYSTVYENAMIALGIKRNYEIKTRCHTAMRYILPDKEGVLSKITIPEEMAKDPNIIEIKITVKEGSKVAPPPKNFDFLGYVSVKGDTQEEAEKKLQDVVNKISIKIN